MPAKLKRSSSAISDADVPSDSEAQDSSPAAEDAPSTPPPTSTPKSKAPANTSPKKAKRTPTPKKKLSPTTPKGKFLAYVISDGMKKIDRAEAEKLTGLKPAQQRELMREDGKGALYNALVKLAEEM